MREGIGMLAVPLEHMKRVSWLGRSWSGGGGLFFLLPGTLPGCYRTAIFYQLAVCSVVLFLLQGYFNIFFLVLNFPV